MWVYIVGSIVLALVIYLAVQGSRCHAAIEERKKRLTTYKSETISLSYGNMTYVDKGQGETILSIHGIFGGYDQAYDTCNDFSSDYRIIAPSRFGYLGSNVLGDGTPSEQSIAYVELLDRLGIEKIHLLATSAGGSIAIRFALDYPERTKGLILFCSAMPYTEKPVEYPRYMGPPAFLCNNYTMFFLSPLFGPIMGMKPSTIYSMLPINDRKEGVVLDASVINPDMAKNYDDYEIEALQVPTLILHSKDDKLVSYKLVEKVYNRFPDCTFTSFETGGHLMVGHSKEIDKTVSDFMHD